ncbi:MAG: proteasome-activating nucleotidase [archaeon]
MTSTNAESINAKDLNLQALTADEENEILKNTVSELHKELEKYRKTPYIVASVVDIINPDEVVIRLNGGDFCVNVANDVKNKIKVNDRVLVEQKSLTLVRIIGTSKHFDVSNYIICEKPNIDWKKIGGLKKEINEIKEVIELPLLHPELFEQVGIDPPKGMLLYGPPGTGKTLLAKAAATNTNSTFLEIVGSELVQKFIGEGAKFVKSIFDLAREKAPSIIFIDELDAIAAKRIEVGTSGEREVQRTFMQLLSEIDGFKHLGNVKVIGATNRLDILDPAITRPGRLDRLLEVPLPNEEGRYEIYNIHTSKMHLEKDVNLKEVARLSTKMSGAEIKSVCTEAGYFAIREKKSSVNMSEFISAIKKVKTEDNTHNNIHMYG